LNSHKTVRNSTTG